MISLGLWVLFHFVFGRKTTETKYPFASHHIRGTSYQDVLSLLMFTLLTWLGYYLSDFSIVKVSHFFLPLHTVLLGGDHYVQPTCKEWGVRLPLLG